MLNIEDSDPDADALAIFREWFDATMDSAARAWQLFDTNNWIVGSFVKGGYVQIHSFDRLLENWTEWGLAGRQEEFWKPGHENVATGVIG
jgi:hypothetical protein